MDSYSEESPVQNGKIRIGTDFLNSTETNATLEKESNRNKRVKKPKQINDLGFEEKTQRKTKNLKVHKEIAKKEPKKLSHSQLIFQKFKESKFYPKFAFFNKIEKSLKANYFQSHQDMATEIRSIFNNYFTASLSDPQSYNDTFLFSNYFEEIYKDYQNKTFSKESKNILELKKKMNKLRREIRERNTPQLPGKTTKLRIDVNDFNISSEKEKKISKKYKMSLVSNIKSLNQEQIKGIINIIHEDLSTGDKTIEFDINSLSLDKLKELDKYVRKCLKSKKRQEENNLTSVGNKKQTYYSSSVNNATYPSLPNLSEPNQNSHPMSGINVNININNNFVMSSFQTENNIYPKSEPVSNTKKRNSILSESDSLSSDEESDSDSLSSLDIQRK